MKRAVVFAVVAVLLATTGAVQAQQRDAISIVGSSTVYPFATVVAEKFGKAGAFKTPKIESTGTGGGFKLFCGGVGVQHPDISNASRAIKASEFETCGKAGVTEIVEVKIGYDGIVLANSKKGPEIKLTTKDIFLALAKEVPDPKGGDALVPNPYKSWKDVNPALPAAKIEVLGPPPTSGTRDAFLELAMEPGALQFDGLKKLQKEDAKKFQKVFASIREDGAYIDAGENDNLIVQKLVANPSAIGIFGFSFLDQNTDKIQGAFVNGGQPTFENIASGKYPLSRPLFFYVKKAHVGVIPGIKEYPGRVHERESLGQGRVPERKGPDPAARRRAQAGDRDRENPEADQRSQIGSNSCSRRAGTGPRPPAATARGSLRAATIAFRLEAVSMMTLARTDGSALARTDTDRPQPKPPAGQSGGTPRVSRDSRETVGRATVDNPRMVCRKVNVYYGDKQAIRDVSIDIAHNEVLAMIGPSGCGKSTFIRCLNRMNDTIEGCRVTGEIVLDGVNIYDKGVDVVPLRAQVGMVFQKPNPFPKSIFENVAYGPRIHGLCGTKSELEARGRELARKAGLWEEVKDRLNQPGTGLSGGQQQRLCIARTIAVNPEVILMDEPCSALDPIATSVIEDLIFELRTQYSICIVTHSMQQAARVSQRTAYFHLGDLIEVGPTERIFTNPRHQLTQDYITGRFG